MTQAERRACQIGDLQPGYCAVHAQEIYRELRPEMLAENEELIDGSFGACEECSARYYDKDAMTYYSKSDGRCQECSGSGECGDQCGHGHTCSAECEACEGSGTCRHCGGSGFGGVRIRTSEAA